MNVVQSAALHILGARIIGGHRTNASGGELEMKLADYADHRIMPIWRPGVAAEDGSQHAEVSMIYQR